MVVPESIYKYINCTFGGHLNTYISGTIFGGTIMMPMNMDMDKMPI